MLFDGFLTTCVLMLFDVFLTASNLCTFAFFFSVCVQFKPQVVLVSCGLDAAIGDEKVLTALASPASESLGCA